jgi:hypothetical protein
MNLAYLAKMKAKILNVKIKIMELQKLRQKYLKVLSKDYPSKKDLNNFNKDIKQYQNK